MRTIEVDFHSHILPAIDDGSRSVEESLAMLRLAKENGIKKIVATPHFYAESNTPQRFLEKREKAIGKLKDAMLSEDLPEVYYGAEAAFFYGMGRSDEVRSVCIEGTDILLVEMPFKRWSDAERREIFSLRERRGLRVVIAHFERFLPFRNERDIYDLAESGCILQSNGEFFLEKKTAKKALKWFERGWIGLLGSDCHNLTSRRQNLMAASETLLSAFGEDAIRAVNHLSNDLLRGAKKI